MKSSRDNHMNDIKIQACRLGCTVRAGSSRSDIRTSTSDIRKLVCVKCSNALPTTIKKELVCPNCGARVFNN